MPVDYNGGDNMSDLEMLWSVRLQCLEEGCAGTLPGLRAVKERGLIGLGDLIFCQLGSSCLKD